MAKIEDITAQSFQFTQVETPSAPVSGRTKIYAKADGKIYSQVNDGAESVLTNDTRFKGLRLAKQIVLTEAAAIIEFDKDNDENPLNSALGGELLFYSGENTSITATAQCYMQLNGVFLATNYWNGISSSTQLLYAGVVSALFSKIKALIDILNDNVCVDIKYSYRYSTAGSSSTYGGGMTTTQTTVSKIKLYLSTGTFPVGTVVEWWERG